MYYPVLAFYLRIIVNKHTHKHPVTYIITTYMYIIYFRNPIHLKGNRILNHLTL